jgi:predicted aspartyl protease
LYAGGEETTTPAMPTLLSLSHILLSLSILFSASTSQVYAATFPFTVHHTLPNGGNQLFSSGAGAGGLTKRANTTVAITNKANAQYIANITLARVDLRVLLDTGSSDLWVNFPGTAPTTTDLGKSVSLNYAIGAASGNVHTAQLQFDSFVIPDQAFCEFPLVLFLIIFVLFWD